MEQNRQPGAPIGPEAKQSTPEQPHRGVFGRLLEKVGIHRPHKGFGPEPGKAVQRGGTITVEGAFGEANAAPQPAPAPGTPMPRIEAGGSGFGVSASPKPLEQQLPAEPTHVMRGGTLMGVGEAARLDSGANPYPSASPTESARAPFTGGSAAPELTPDQAAQAFGPVGPNSVSRPEQPQTPVLPSGSVHNLPVEGQRR